MAQTKRKRKHRHRGTQAGTIERSGRTSKPAGGGGGGKSPGSSRQTGASVARAKREARLDTPPTWRGSLNRAGVAAAILVLFIAITTRNVAQGVALGVIALAAYIPMSYYTDRALYRRRQRRKQSAGGR